MQPSRNPVSFILLFLLISISSALAQENTSLDIGKIHIKTDDIYDLSKPELRRSLYTWANKLHIKTSKNVVRRELLFKEGDIYDPALITESERILRSYHYFRKVNIHVSEPEDNTVDVTVETCDVWTTEPRVDWGHTAGETTWLAGIKERNFLGQGQSISAFYKKTLDDRLKTFSFNDPRFLNTHFDIGGNYDEGKTDESWDLKFIRPFFATTAKWSAGIYRASENANRKLYTNGKETSSFDVNHRFAKISAGHALSSTRHKKSTLSLLYARYSDEYSNLAMSSTATPPRDIELNGVTLSYSLENISFIKERHILKFDRDEDFNLGAQHALSYGIFPKDFGSSHNEQLVEYYYNRGLKVNSGHFALLTLFSKNHLRNRKARNSELTISTQYYKRISEPQTIASYLEFSKLFNPDNDKQLLLGGESGLRGYSVRQFSGNKKLFFSIEDRLFLKDDLWKLFSVGGALFFDSGMAWRKDAPVRFSKIRSDVGIGLRFGLTRSSAAQVIRIDLAYALNKNYEDSRWVLTIKSGQIFKPKEAEDYRGGN